LDNITLEKLKLRYTTTGCILKQNEDESFTIKKDGKERMITESQLLDECRKMGWV
jgi:hypothetical protein